MKSLLSFSGGRDSAYVAYRMLKDTDDELTIMLLRKKPGSECKWSLKRAETLRVPHLIEELKKIRSFDVIDEYIDDDDLTYETDHPNTYFIDYGVKRMNEGQYDRLVTGQTFEQIDSGPNGGAMPSVIAGDRLFKQISNRGSLWQPLISHDYHKNFGRYHVLKYLPDNIKQYTISCQNPKVNNDMTWCDPCGKCMKCVWEKLVCEMVDEDKTSDDIDHWRREKSLEYGGGNSLMCPMRFWLSIELGLEQSTRSLFKTKEDAIAYTQKHKINPNMIAKHEKWKRRDGIWEFLT